MAKSVTNPDTTKSFEFYLGEFENTRAWTAINNIVFKLTGKALPVTLTNVLEIPFDIDNLANVPEEQKESVMYELHLFSYIAHELWKKELVI